MNIMHCNDIAIMGVGAITLCGKVEYGGVVLQKSHSYTLSPKKSKPTRRAERYPNLEACGTRKTLTQILALKSGNPPST